MTIDYPLIDLGDGVEIPVPKSSAEIAGDDLDDGAQSSEPEIDDNVDTGLQARRNVMLTQREAFNSYLRTTDDRTVASREEKVSDEERPQPATRMRIIDEVRQYQQELFEKALDENVIAVLDTGSGKTLIACLLVRHTLSEELLRRSQGKAPKVVVFLANSVHLVQQQARVLANNLPVRPMVFIGDYKAEVWKESKIWSDIVDKSIPIVCTPAVLQQCLHAALIRIDQISLLVFDEAHHAKKDHPYSRIMRSHYMKCDLEDRPKVFGMTASPVHSKGNINANISDLEELLHCKVVTASDPSKLSFVPKPKDVIWKYQKLRLAFETDLCGQIRSRCPFAQELLQKGFIFAKQATSILGTWCADRAWRYVIGASEHEAVGVIKRFEQSAAYLGMESIEQREKAIEGLQEVVMLVLEKCREVPTATLTNLSSKVLQLYEELWKIYALRPDTRGIVFVDQRLTANVLNDCFLRLGVPNLRTGLLLGTAQDSTSLKKQESLLDQFRAGLINLIFATSVADEGIDIPQCNLCVRFDLYKSPIQYIQSRGRARMENSVYAHMVEEDNAVHESDLKFAINSGKYIKEYCEKLDPNRLLGQGTKLEKMIARDSNSRSFKTNAGAICDFENSLLVLSRFASSLHYLGAIEKESYEEEIDEANQLFRYVVRLSPTSDIGVTGARGEWKPNKALAKRSAAWNCCFLLRKNGVLDESLNSPFHKVKPANLNARLAISEKSSAYTMLTKPIAWEEGLGQRPSKLYVNLVLLKPQRDLRREHSTLVFLTRVQLPQFPRFKVYLEDAVETDVSLDVGSQSINVSSAELDLLTNFTLNEIFFDVFNKAYEIDSTRLSYWLAPLSTNPVLRPAHLSDIVNLDALRSSMMQRTKWSAGSQVDGVWTNKFLCDPRNGKFHYFTKQIAPGISIFDPVPDTVPHVAPKGMKNIIDFSDSFWRASKRNFAEATYDPNQPVIEAELLVTRRNFLEPGTEKDRRQIMCLIAPQPLEVSRLDPSFAASCIVWPSIIHRLESYMIALEAFKNLDLPGVPADLALEAFTKDTDAEDQEYQTHTGLRHGMGKNYERLEFIGDSLLKMMTTITVFNRTKCDEEGMHCRRMEILCNRRLFEVSTGKHHLYRYARTIAFNRMTWYPENLVLLKGRGAKKTPEPVKHPEQSQNLGMKTIADISEAVIGAAVTSSRAHQNKFDLGIKAITKLVDSEDHAITSWSEIIEMYEAPEWSLKMNDIQANRLAEEIATRTGYHFRCPRLLRSAFTHSSDTNSTVPDLQRLEFLGDAVLDWVCIDWLFETNPDRNPQWLTEHKMAMVSNKFLAALSVVLDFDKFLFCSTAKLYADITFYAKRVREAFADKDVNPDFWTHIDSPPKALSDLVESYIGAVLVDSTFNYNEIEKFFNEHILWFFKDISRYDSFANRHPTTFLYKKIENEFKCRNFNVIASDTDEGMVEARVTAGVLIHNKVVADASGTSARYAKVRASQRALTKLDGMTIETFRSTFGCYCKVKDNQD